MTRHPERMPLAPKRGVASTKMARAFSVRLFDRKHRAGKTAFNDASKNSNRALPSPALRGSFIATSGSGSQFNPLQEEFFFERRRTSIWKWNSATEMNVFVSRVIIESLDGIPFDRIRRGYTNLGTAENLSDDRIWKSSFPDKLIRPLSTVLWNLSIGRRGTREGFVNFQCLL